MAAPIPPLPPVTTTTAPLTCSTCRARVLEGEVEMAVNHALEDYEVRQGYVLTCQCYPLSDRVVVSYDQ